MSTSFMKAVTLSEQRAYDILSKRTDGKLCLKRAIAAILFNNTGADLQYDTVLKNGKVEVKGGTLPAAFAGAIQPDGELNVLIDAKKRPTHEKLYDVAKPLTREAAFEMALWRGLTITKPEMVIDAMKCLTTDPDPRQIPWIYAEAKGRVIPFRCGLSFELPKAGWGQVQTAEIDSALVVNTITSEVYYIGRTELVNNWVMKDNQGADATEFWNALPKISDDEFNAMIVPA